MGTPELKLVKGEMKKAEVITFADLQNVQGVLGKILNCPMEFKLSYRLKKVTQKVIEELKFMDEARTELVKKYCDKNNEGNPITDEKGGAVFTPEHRVEFGTEYRQLVETPVDFNFCKIPFELLENSDIKLSAMEIVLLDKFIAEPEVGKELD